MYLRNNAVNDDFLFALLQVLVRDVSRYSDFLMLYSEKRISQDVLIKNLDHLSEKIRLEVVAFSGSQKSHSVKVGASISVSARREIFVEIKVSGKQRLRKVFNEGHVTVWGNGYGVSRGGDFLVMEKNGVFAVEPLGKMMVVVVPRATKTVGGDFLINPNEWYDCTAGSFEFSLRINS